MIFLLLFLFLSSGLLRFDNDIEVGEEVVLISTKGEAVAVAVAQMTTAQVFYLQRESTLQCLEYRC